MKILIQKKGNNLVTSIRDSCTHEVVHSLGLVIAQIAVRDKADDADINEIANDMANFIRQCILEEGLANAPA